MFNRGFAHCFALLLAAEPAEGATPTVAVSTDPPESKPTESATGTPPASKGGKDAAGKTDPKPDTAKTDDAEPEKRFSQADVDRILKERLERDREQQKAKAAEAAEKVRREAEEKALKEQGDWKKLAEQREADLKAREEGLTKAQSELRQTRLSHAVEIAAYALDFTDPDDAKLADLSSVTFDENGQPNRAEIKAALEKLLEAKPHFKLKEEPATKPRATGTPGGSPRPTLPVNRDPRANNADGARRRNVL